MSRRPRSGPLYFSSFGAQPPRDDQRRFIDTPDQFPLHAFAKAPGATILGARISRYVIDLNRPPNDENLYPGPTTASPCPTE